MPQFGRDGLDYDVPPGLETPSPGVKDFEDDVGHFSVFETSAIENCKLRTGR